MTSINNAAPKPELRSPRGFITINNIQVPWERFEVSNTRYSAASTFKITVPVSSLPNTMSLSTMVSSSPLTVQVNAGLPTQTNLNNVTPSDLPIIIIGDADNIMYDPDRTLVTLTGRDYISKFLDNKLNQLNNAIGAQIQSILSYSKSSDIVSMIATNRGLTPNVTPTTNNIGIYLQTGYSLLNSQITEWDLMTFLAREEGYDIYVIGSNLYFKPKDSSNPYQITLTVPYYTTSGSIPTSNAVKVQLTRNLRLAKDIIVQVTSWNVNDKVTYTKVSTLKHAGSSGQSIPLIYNYRFPNLTADQCLQKSQTLLLEISQHELQLNFEMPASTLLTAHGSVIVKDTNSLYDQIYYVKNIMREMDFGGGFNMHVEAKTTPPYTVSTQ